MAHLTRMQDLVRAALDAYNHLLRLGHRSAGPQLDAATAEANDLWRARQAHSFPDSLWGRPAAADLTDWPGLPYALLFLEWEARYPEEWTRCAKSWGTKQRLIRDLAAARLDVRTRAKLVELIGIVVARPYRCKDREFVRLARSVDGEDLRRGIAAAAASDSPWARIHAGYLEWMLDHPDTPNSRRVWRTWLASDRA
ncbi:hypothetical protein [Kitasatospora sp. NPDC089509]|uniref:hypothetical protein n=1 Tax=Kitasatospora sp. NPDC089509 TaxID=3364079 RepID=UPI00381EB4DD